MNTSIYSTEKKGAKINRRPGGVFVVKMDLDTLTVVWKQQFGSEGVEATGCATDGSLVYVGGAVVPGVKLQAGDFSKSVTSDLFVGLLDGGSDGDISFPTKNRFRT